MRSIVHTVSALLQTYNLHEHIFKKITGQQWKLDGTVLTDRANCWKSRVRWEFIPQGNSILIRNSVKKTVIGIKGNKIVEEAFIENNIGQLWRKGAENVDGFFPLINPQSDKFLTAATSKNLVALGKVDQ